MRDPLNRYLLGADADAFAEVVRDYEDVVFCAAKAILRNADDGLDASQETFLRLWNQRGSVRSPIRRPRAWILGLAIFAAKDLQRGRLHMRREEEIAAGLPPRDANDPIREIEARDEIQTEISFLPETQRDCIVLRYMLGLSYREIGDALNLSIQTVGSKIARAKAALRRILTPASFAILCLRLARPRPVTERIPRSLLEEGPVADLIARARIRGEARPLRPSRVPVSPPGLPALVATGAGVLAIVAAVLSFLPGGTAPLPFAPSSPPVATAPAGPLEAAEPAEAGAAILLGADPGPADPARGILVSGAVVTAERGEPVALAFARLRTRDGCAIGEARGDEEGRFEISGIRPKKGEPEGEEGLVLSVGAEGFLEREVALAWEELGPETKIRIEVAPAAPIEGIATDGAGRPVADAEIFARWGVVGVNACARHTSSARSGQDGRFTIASPRGWVEARFLAFAEGKGWARGAWTAVGDSTPLQVVLRNPVSWTASAEDERGAAIPRARVSLIPLEGDAPAPWQDWEEDRFVRRYGSFPYRAQTDDLGRFSLAELPPGRYEVRVGGLCLGKPVEVQDGAAPVTIRLAAGRTISGLVLLPENEPAARARIHIFAADGRRSLWRGQADADGAFFLGGLEEGRVFLQAWCGTFFSESVPVEPGQDRVVLCLSAAPDPDPPLPGRISLRITVEGMRIPPDAIRVKVLRGGRPVDAIISHLPGGVIELSLLPLAPVDVLLDPSGAAAAILRGIRPSADGAFPIPVDLHAGLTFRGIVEGEENVSSGTVGLYDPSGTVLLRTAPLGTGGAFEWVHVDPGPYLAEVTIDARRWTEEVVLEPDGRLVRLGPAPSGGTTAAF